MYPLPDGATEESAYWSEHGGTELRKGESNHKNRANRRGKKGKKCIPILKAYDLKSRQRIPGKRKTSGTLRETSKGGEGGNRGERGVGKGPLCYKGGNGDRKLKSFKFPRFKRKRQGDGGKP